MRGTVLAALVAVGLVILTVATPSIPIAPAPAGGQGVADVKTCGCPWDAKCGDCCGISHCKCEKNPSR